MKKRSIALLLALVMCLFSACGGKPDAAEPPAPSVNTPGPAVQQPEDKEQPEEPGEPAPEVSEPEEPEEPENTAGMEFLALLQEEWNHGLVQGQGPRHTYQYKTGIPFIYNGAVLLYHRPNYCSYDMATKEFKEILPVKGNMSYPVFRDGKFYFTNGNRNEYGVEVYDISGERLDFWPEYQLSAAFEEGIVATYIDSNTGEPMPTLFSYDGEKIADLPLPQREVDHGLTEDVRWWMCSAFAADGTLYAADRSMSMYWRLNMDTLAWENMGTLSEVTDDSLIDNSFFCGKYIPGKDGIYDCGTGERVFEYGELYPASWGLWYFGGDRYLGNKNGEYRWVSLTDLSMSDPLPFPEGKWVTVLDDTYCVYEDQYGWFLWNYNTGEEETIMLYGR